MACKDVQDQDNALASVSLLRELSGQLVKWKFLGRELGLSDANLYNIERDNNGDSEEMKYQTLLKWRQTAERPTIGCLAKALKKVGRTDLAVSIMQDGPVETTLTLHDLKALLSLTVQDCYEIAIYLRLPARDVQQIKQSQNSAVDLIDKINDGRDNSDSTINALLFALQNRGKTRAANLILHSEGLPSSIKARASSKEDALPACLCGQNSYEILKSHSDESSVVSLLCNSCEAEWFPTTESAKLLLVWEDKKFSYKIPRTVEFSKLKYVHVKDVNELQRGDHIVFRRGMIYDHHAIFVHISENEKEKIKLIHWSVSPVLINCEDISFPKGGVRRVQYPESDPVDVVVARAYDILFSSSQKYDFANNNCECLAMFCKIGKSFSIRGEKVDLISIFKS